MNKKLADYARTKLKSGLLSLPESNQLIFKRMYSHEDLNKNIEDVVNDMPEERLDWALTQVQNSLELNKG